MGGGDDRIQMAQKKKGVKGRKRSGGMKARSREGRQNKLCVENAIL